MKKVINSLLVLYSLRFARTITYMLQATEYQAKSYYLWLYKVDDFSKVIIRKELIKTSRAKLLMNAINLGIALEILIGIILIYLGLKHKVIGGVYFGAATIVAYPVLFMLFIPILVVLAKILIVSPKEKQSISEAKHIFSKTKARKIAVAGSYGKTSMKELLSQVLSSKFKVASTKGNMNVATSIARFAKKLSSKEEILIIEFGEGAPGDIKKFSDMVDPNMAVITGLAPAHLDRYKSIENAGKDIFELAKHVGDKNVYVNADSEAISSFITKEMHSYTSAGIDDCKITAIKSTIKGISFNLSYHKKELKIHSKLIGRHQVGPLALACVIAIDLGIPKASIEKAISDIKAYEHRMQPYEINGATIIDDTYNGNIEGIKAGTSLLKELKGGRKIYVTPGLVDQGKLTKEVHLKMGELIADANPDLVVLMGNSATKYIKEGLKKSGYNSELQIQDDPMMFYSNLSSFVASGDIVLMQNDWTDNYN